MISILIADDQDLVRAGLRTLLTNDPSIKVVAEARDGQEALHAVEKHRPDLVLMDIRMPGMDGIVATREICNDPDLRASRVVMLTTFDDDADIIEAIRAGAVGYLLKDISSEDLRMAAKAVAEGANLLSPQVTRKVMNHLAAAPTHQETADIDLTELTAREVEVLTRISHGETNTEIAKHLYLSPATARTYVSRILTKLHARDRTELAIIGHRAGLYTYDR